jgi:hypothetical protein
MEQQRGVRKGRNLTRLLQKQNEKKSTKKARCQARFLHSCYASFALAKQHAACYA